MEGWGCREAGVEDGDDADADVGRRGTGGAVATVIVRIQAGGWLG